LGNWYRLRENWFWFGCGFFLILESILWWSSINRFQNLLWSLSIIGFLFVLTGFVKTLIPEKNCDPISPSKPEKKHEETMENQTSNSKDSEKKALLKIYDRVLEDHRHNDKVGYDLISFTTLTNSGLISVVALILCSSLSLSSRFYLASAFCFGGFMINIVFFLLMSRNKVYLHAWTMKGRNLEDKLKKDYNIDFDHFETQRMIQEEREFVYYIRNKENKEIKNTYSLKFWEKIRVHTWIIRFQAVVAIVWILLSILIWNSNILTIILTS
jgi:hypothetical protein